MIELSDYRESIIWIKSLTDSEIFTLFIFYLFEFEMRDYIIFDQISNRLFYLISNLIFKSAKINEIIEKIEYIFKIIWIFFF